MNYQAFTNDSLTMMYEGVRGALAADNALKQQGDEPKFRIRETPEWKTHAADLEAEMLSRGMIFEIVDWSGGQASFPLRNEEGQWLLDLSKLRPASGKPSLLALQHVPAQPRSRASPFVPLEGCRMHA